MYEGGLISEAERNTAKAAYDGAKAALDSANSGIEQAEGALRQINEALSKTIIASPVDGTISSLTSRAGERVV